MLKKIFLIFFIILISKFSFAQDKNISIMSVADKDTITVGEKITLAVKVFLNDKIKQAAFSGNINFFPFELLDYIVHEDEILDDGRIQKRIDYIVTIYDTGDFELPAIDIAYRDIDDKAQSLASEKIKIKVKSVIEGDIKDVKDVKDIKDIYKIKSDLIKLSFIILGSILLIALIYGIYLFYKSKKIKKQQELLLQLTPEEIAIKSLEKLKEQDLISKGKIKKFYIELSEIIKIYLEAKYNILAVEYTTTEIMSSLKNMRLDRQKINLINEFLSDSDLVKFAKWIPDNNYCLKNFKDAEEIIK